MVKVNKGDLAYIPSNTRLSMFHNGVLKKFIEPENPIHGLVAEAEGALDRVVVLYEGNYWHVNSRNVYQLEDK